MHPGMKYDRSRVKRIAENIGSDFETEWLASRLYENSFAHCLQQHCYDGHTVAVTPCTTVVEARKTVKTLLKAQAALEKPQMKTHIEALPEVTRVELVVNGERVYTTWRASRVMVSSQDEGRTVKLFLDGPETKPSPESHSIKASDGDVIHLEQARNPLQPSQKFVELLTSDNPIYLDESASRKLAGYLAGVVWW